MHIHNLQCDGLLRGIVLSWFSNYITSRAVAPLGVVINLICENKHGCININPITLMQRYWGDGGRIRDEFFMKILSLFSH